MTRYKIPHAMLRSWLFLHEMTVADLAKLLGLQDRHTLKWRYRHGFSDDEIRIIAERLPAGGVYLRREYPDLFGEGD